MNTLILLLESQMTVEAMCIRLAQINLRLLIIDIKIHSLKNKLTQ